MDLGTRLYQAKEFAAKAGVSVRTLHFYDRVGLLTPAARTEAGYRLYGDAELERLEQILALRFVGFELDRIKTLLNGPPTPLLVALRMQRHIIAQEKRRLEHVADALEHAEALLENGGDSAKWQAVQNVIEAFKVKSDYSWTDNYYTDEDKAKLEAMRKNLPPGTIEEGQRAWAELIAEVEAAAETEDPLGEGAQVLAARWKALVHQFTQGDEGIKRGLNKLWSDQTHWPKDFKRPWSDKADAFIHQALKCES